MKKLLLPLIAVVLLCSCENHWSIDHENKNASLRINVTFIGTELTDDEDTQLASFILNEMKEGKTTQEITTDTQWFFLKNFGRFNPELTVWIYGYRNERYYSCNGFPIGIGVMLMLILIIIPTLIVSFYYIRRFTTKKERLR